MDIELDVNNLSCSALYSYNILNHYTSIYTYFNHLIVTLVYIPSCIVNINRVKWLVLTTLLMWRAKLVNKSDFELKDWNRIEIV